MNAAKDESFNSKVVRLEAISSLEMPRPVISFNSKVVRLEVVVGHRLTQKPYCFNSKVVRLEVKGHTAADLRATEFQFQGGAVRSGKVQAR